KIEKDRQPKSSKATWGRHKGDFRRSTTRLIRSTECLRRKRPMFQGAVTIQYGRRRDVVDCFPVVLIPVSCGIGNAGNQTRGMSYVNTCRGKNSTPSKGDIKACADG